MDPMSIMSIAKAGAGQIAGLAQGLIGGRKRRREERAAQAEFNRMKERFMGLDTSNPYANMENVYEDLTVNTQAAEFAAQQQQQGTANILGGLQGAAGGSGIAALAQSLAQQQSQAAQQASASIGAQEARNQAFTAQGAASIQSQERQGEVLSRQMEQQKTNALLQMSAGRLQQAKAARQQATQSLIGGITGAAGLAGGAAIAGKGNLGEGFREMAGMQSSLPSPGPSLDTRVMQSMPSATDALMENANFALPSAGAYTFKTLTR